MILKKGLLAALAAVKEKANQLDVSVRDLASTLILVVTTGNLVAAAQVRDGAAVIGDRCSGNIIPLTIPYGGKYANQTTFLISPHGLETAQIKVWRGMVGHLAIFSYGLQRLTF